MAADQKYVCCNADEGDSGTYADRMIMEGDPFVLIEGMTIAGFAVGATSGYIYIRSEYPHAFRTMKRAIALAYDNGYLGANVAGSRRRFDLDIRLGAGAYICGEESSMLESLEGRRGQIRPRPPVPAVAGLFGRPTVVNNVISLATVPIILDKGSAYLAHIIPEPKSASVALAQEVGRDADAGGPICAPSGRRRHTAIREVRRREIFLN